MEDREIGFITIGRGGERYGGRGSWSVYERCRGIEERSRGIKERYRGAYGVVAPGIAAGRERYIGGAVLRHDFIALSLDQE